MTPRAWARRLGPMPYVVAALAVLTLVALGVAGLTGRFRAASCCAPADPRRDARMRGAFEDDAR